MFQIVRQDSVPGGSSLPLPFLPQSFLLFHPFARSSQRVAAPENERTGSSHPSITAAKEARAAQIDTCAEPQMAYKSMSLLATSI